MKNFTVIILPLSLVMTATLQGSPAFAEYLTTNYSLEKTPETTNQFISPSRLVAQSYQGQLIRIYGRPNCPITQKLMQELRVRKIPFQFKDVKNQAVVDELFALGAQNHIDASCCRVPLVGVEETLLVNPKGVKIDQVLTALKSIKPKTQATALSDGEYFTEKDFGEKVLEVKGEQFRLTAAGMPPEQWRSLSELKLIQPGVVYFNKTYWCSPKHPNRNASCTANGWVEK